MRRLIVVYNPNSSQYIHVEKEVLSRIRKIQGYVIGKFAIKKTDFETNVKSLKSLLRAHDTVIAAGGDATAAVAVNAILESQKDITLGVLPYGNFNDLARTLGTMKYDDISASIAKLYPLDIIVDGKHWRYATCYTTIGMTAEAVELFDNPKIRAKMQQGHRSSWRSYLQLASWYFKNRHRKQFLPEFRLNGKLIHPKTSDYAAVNGYSMCRVMRGGRDYLKPHIFRSETERTTSFLRLFMLMAKSILHRVPGCDTEGDLLEFVRLSTVEVQAEGEYHTFENVRRIEIKKPAQYLKVIHK